MEEDLDRELEAFFRASRARPVMPSPDLLERVLADAYDAQDAQDAVRAATAAAAGDKPARPAAPGGMARRGRVRGWLGALGGWPALAGLASATVAGVWIGFHPPAFLDGVSPALFDAGYGLTMDSSLPDYGFMLADG